MKQVNIFLLGALMSLVFFLSCKETSSELSLAGEWQFALDPAESGQALCRCSLVSEEGECSFRLGEPTGSVQS